LYWVVILVEKCEPVDLVLGV